MLISTKTLLEINRRTVWNDRAPEEQLSYWMRAINYYLQQMEIDKEKKQRLRSLLLLLRDERVKVVTDKGAEEAFIFLLMRGMFMWEIFWSGYMSLEPDDLIMKEIVKELTPEIKEYREYFSFIDENKNDLSLSEEWVQTTLEAVRKRKFRTLSMFFTALFVLKK